MDLRGKRCEEVNVVEVPPTGVPSWGVYTPQDGTPVPPEGHHIQSSIVSAYT